MAKVGGFRPGAGRKKGSKNKHKASFRESLRAYCAELGVDPHRFMADLLADTSLVTLGVDAYGAMLQGPAVSLALKFQAAKELAQYLEPKLKATEHSGDVNHHHSGSLTWMQHLAEVHHLLAEGRNGHHVSTH